MTHMCRDVAMYAPPPRIDYAVQSILSNHPMIAQEDRVRKRRSYELLPFIDTLIPGLPDDVVRRILAQLPRSKWPHLRSVCKAWGTALADASFHQSRVDLKLTEEWLYTEAWDPETKVVSWYAFEPSQRKWYALPPIPTIRGRDRQIFGRASAVLRGELYIVGGKVGQDGPTLREMYIYSPFTHKWRKGQRMLTTRHTPLMVAMSECKIFVLGGFDCFDENIVTGESYDVDTKLWSIVGNDGNPDVLKPKLDHKVWELQWNRFLFNNDEFFISYTTTDGRQVMKYYIPRKGSWEEVAHRPKSIALLLFGVGCVVDMNIVLLDWVNGRLRYTLHPHRAQDWKTVPGVAKLKWKRILRTKPKVIGIGTKLVLVGSGLSVLMIETHRTLLEATDRDFIDDLPPVLKAPNLAPISCVEFSA